MADLSNHLEKSKNSYPSDRFFTYNYEQLLSSGIGELHGKDFPPLPAPPMLMFDEISKIDPNGGASGKGYLEAKLNINPKLWFFDCHFKLDPVMPGCLGLDALWQLLGFYLGWLGAKGKGRALGAGNVKFSGQVLPENKLVTYKVELTRLRTSPLYMGVGNGEVWADNEKLYDVENLKVGVMTNKE